MITDQKAIRALAWSAIDRTCQQLVQLFVGILLARLLAPSDFGLMGIIMVFAGVSYTLVEGGLGQAVIKEHKNAHRYYSSVWYMQMTISLLIYCTFFFTAPLIAKFFHQEHLIWQRVLQSFFIIHIQQFGLDIIQLLIKHSHIFFIGRVKLDITTVELACP